MQSGDSFRDVLNLGIFFLGDPEKGGAWVSYLTNPQLRFKGITCSQLLGYTYQETTSQPATSRPTNTSCHYPEKLPSSFAGLFWHFPSSGLAYYWHAGCIILLTNATSRRCAGRCHKNIQKASDGLLSADYNLQWSSKDGKPHQVIRPGCLVWLEWNDWEGYGHLDFVPSFGGETDTQSKYCSLKFLARLQRHILVHSYHIRLCQWKARGQVWF